MTDRDAPGRAASGLAARLTALLGELEDTQWQPPESLAALQLHRLGTLAAHLVKHSPHFAGRLRAAGLSVAELSAPGGLQRLPVLSRRLLQSSADVYCGGLPPHHAPTYETRTSGSTGEPVVVHRTAVNGLDWMAATMRDHLWHERDFKQAFCSIRGHIREPVLLPDWGQPVNLLFDSGPLLGIPITTAIERQLELVREFKPHLLQTYPSNLAGIVSRCGGVPGVRHILTMGETLSPETRADAARLFGATIDDSYSSQELGIIAIQCAASTLHHVMAETLIVEVLNADGGACREGEMGRVVATDLRNFATPLIRYDIGDWAEVGPPCSCGRGLPTLSRIFGRERNLILMPDGTRHWPHVGFPEFREIAPVMQYQFIQDGRETIEIRLVTERRLSRREEGGLAAHIQKTLGFPFELRFTYFAERIPAGPTGKFEEFVCRVGA
jgi:phenylacetate-CoA ligase